MPRKIVILLLIIFIGSLSFPFLTLAGEYQGYGGTVHYEGFVPCGKSQVGPGESDEVTKPCEFCHLFVMLDGIIDFFMINILPPVVVLMMVIAGIMFFFAGGNPTLLLQAKKLITSVVIGVVIIFSAYLMIGTVFKVMRVVNTNPLYEWAQGNVFIVNCPIGEDGDGVVSEEEEEEEEEDEINTYSESVEGNPGDQYIERTVLCGEGEIAESGSCEAGEDTSVVTGESGMTDDEKGWHCKFKSLFSPTSPSYTVPPSGEVTVNCVEDESG